MTTLGLVRTVGCDRIGGKCAAALATGVGVVALCCPCAAALWPRGGAHVQTEVEDVWIDVVSGEVEEARKLIESVHPKHPFDEKYNRVSDIDWESCATVLDEEDKKKVLAEGW